MSIQKKVNMFNLKKSIKSLYTDKILLYVNNKCNAKCDYCAISNQRKLSGINHSLDAEMSLETFNEIINSIKNEKNIKRVNFKGKEPSLWQHIDYALKKVKEIGKESIYYTNGINKKEVYPDEISLHVDKEFINKYNVDLDFFQNHTKNNNILFTISFVINSKSNINYYLDIALKYGDIIAIIPEAPCKFKEEDKIGLNKAIELARKIREKSNKLIDIVHGPVPCLISEENKEFLENNKDFINIDRDCEAPKDTVIDLDGKISFSCFMLPTHKTIIDKGFTKLLGNHLIGVHKLRKNMPMKKCYDCDYYKKMLCQGGCLVNRWFLDEIKE